MILIQQFETRDGAAVAKIAIAVDKHQGTVERWKRTGRIPDIHDRYLVALACGCSNEEAVKIANEASSGRARETA